uniref:Uncharacterized protein n=1 Tax=viral metagenome TaxID=1070528 RepID=A0A6M3IIY4_9ZZZZ
MIEKDTWKVLAIESIIACFAILVIVFFWQRPYSEQKLKNILKDVDKIIVGNVTISEKGTLSDTIIWYDAEDANSFAVEITGNNCVIKDYYFTREETKYDLDRLFKYKDLFDEVTMFDFDYWYYDNEWILQYYAKKNGIKYEFETRHNNLNTAIAQMCNKIEERMKE